MTQTDSLRYRAPDSTDDTEISTNIPEIPAGNETPADNIIRVPTVTVVRAVPKSAEVYIQLPPPDEEFTELVAEVVDGFLVIRYGDYVVPKSIPAVSVYRTEYRHPDLLMLDLETEK